MNTPSFLPAFAEPQPLEPQEAVEIVGADCLAYVAASEPDEIRGWAAGENHLDERQNKALSTVLQVLGSPMVRSPRENEAQRYAAVSTLTMFDGDADTTIANLIRDQAGGKLPEIPTADPVEEAAAHLARDSFVAILVPQGERTFQSPFSAASISRNPWNLRFQEAVLADPDLGRHFTGPADSDASSFSYMSTTGRGEGGVQLVLLAERILSTPAAMCRARRASAVDFVAAGIEAVSHLRRLVVEGRTVRAPTLLGFDSINVPSDTYLDTAWGRLRALTDGEQELVRTYSGSGNAVLETECPVKLYVGDAAGLGAIDIDSQTIDAIREARIELEERARMVALAVLLAQDLPMPAGVGLRYTIVEDPFGWMPALSGRIDSQPRAPVELTAEGVSALGDWLAHLAEHHHSSMNVAVRRTLSAHERMDPTDAFIDALIAWDSLFGVRSGDAVTFRVAVGFALVLGGSEEERREIKRRAQDLYGLRSDLVHGSVPELPWKEAGEHREEAVRLLVRALRILYRDQSDLLASGDRAGDLVMRLSANGQTD